MFYSNNLGLLPPKPKLSFRYLKQGIQEFHRKYVLAPADKKKVREKSRECHYHKPQPFQDIKRKRKPTKPNKHKSICCMAYFVLFCSCKISSLFPKRGNRNAKRTEKHKNTMAQGKTYNKSPRRINHKSTKE